MTQLFYSYKQGSEFEFTEIRREKPIEYRKGTIALLIIVIVAASVMYTHFDQFFPLETNVKIIAHRAGGNEGRENTISGLETAWNLGAYGSEIDIQRTKDGYYVLNHDGTFKRVAGDDRRPEDMTLREVKKLSIDGEPVPTYEEMLIASKGRMVLFTELKGNTADKQMADDAVSLIKQYQMEDECVLISLAYDVIDYIETTYPEIQTGFLTFASFGETAALNCDYIGLEEESATSDAIKTIHDEGKKVLVWTANEEGSQKHFLCTDVDGLITDNVSQALGLVEELEHRSDLDRMVDKIKTIF
jgi:glycerophosphoryl diester phosphodiesterase